MIKEYKYWMRERSVKINHNGIEYKLNLYSPVNDRPRPESYSEDIHTASYFQDENEKAMSDACWNTVNRTEEELTRIDKELEGVKE